VKRFKLCLVFNAVVLVLGTAAFAQNGRPLTLEECVQMALDKNSQYLNAERQVRVAEANVASARAAILPSINSSFSSSRSHFVFDGVRVDQRTGTLLPGGTYRNSHFAQISLRQNLFDFGASWNTIRQSSASKTSTEHSFQAAKQGTILAVHERYYQFLKDLRLLEVAREAANLSEEQLKRTESMYEIGSVSQGDVFKAKTTFGNDKISLIQQENVVKNSRMALNVVLGRAAEAALEIADLNEIDAPKAYEMTQVMQTAVQNNPNLKRYEASMSAASYGVKVGKAQYLPALNLSAAYTRNDPEYNKVYSTLNRNFNANLGLSVDFNLFNGFADKARVDREAANYQIARENMIEQERLLRQQAQQSLLALDAWREISAINNDNLASAQEDLRLAQERYRVGAGTLLDIITAQASLTRAKSTLIRARYDAKIAEAQLQEAMGALGR